MRSQVVTYGFPAGGQQISYTRGVVSRIEVESYVHIGNRAFLAVQTDAAINPGNSGGPVIQDDKVVGVAFEGLTGLQNTGYFIPTVIIQHFLDRHQGRHLRRRARLRACRWSRCKTRPFAACSNCPRTPSAACASTASSTSPTRRRLMKVNDVVMQVGDYPVDEDGTITYQGNTVGVSVAFDLAQDGDTMPLKVWRDGKMIDVDLPVKVYDARLSRRATSTTSCRPIISTAAWSSRRSRSITSRASAATYSQSGGRDLIYELVYRHLEDPKHWRPQPVVLSSILDAEVNANLSTRGQALVDTINGQTINQLSDVPKAFAAAKGPFDVIEFFPDHHFEVLLHDDAAKALPDILTTYSVPAQSRL